MLVRLVFVANPDPRRPPIDEGELRVLAERDAHAIPHENDWIDLGAEHGMRRVERVRYELRREPVRVTVWVSASDASA